MDGKGFLDKGQQAVLERFFKEEKIWYPDYWYLCFAGGLMLVPAMFLFIMPFQIWEGDYTSVLVVLVLELAGLEVYLGRYVSFRAEGKIKDVYEVLQFLPLSRCQFKRYRIGKLFRLCLKLTGTAAICQTAFAGVFMHTFSIGNILMPVLLCFLVPMVIACCQRNYMC